MRTAQHCSGFRVSGACLAKTVNPEHGKKVVSCRSTSLMCTTPPPRSFTLMPDALTLYVRDWTLDISDVSRLA